MTREDIYLYARGFAEARVPWRHRGRSATGLDCGGVVIMACRHFEVPHEDIEGYSRYPDGSLMTTLGAHLTLVQPPVKPGMVAVIRDASTPCHVGIVGLKHGALTMIHATLAKRVVREEPFAPFAAKLRALFDFPGVED